MGGELSGKTALVTGAARRIGRAVALHLAEHGADVVVHYRRSFEEAAAVAEQIERLGRRAWTLEADLSDGSVLCSVIENAFAMAGNVGILVNNASSFAASEFETMTLEDLLESIKVEAWAPFTLGRDFARIMGGGHIVNILDTRVAGFDWKHTAYHAAKHMLGLFTREMAIKLAPDVAVNAVAPGLILPPAGKDAAYLEGLKDALPLKRIGDPRDVAEAVLYLVTSRFVTGQVIFVDGGRHLSEPDHG